MHAETNRPLPWWIPVVVCLAIGLLYAAPLGYLMQQGYRLYYPSYAKLDSDVVVHDGTMNDELYYFSLVREMYDSGLPVSQGYTLEEKSYPPRGHAGGEIILGAIARLVGGIDRGRLVSTFIFPALVAWLFYLWALDLLGDRRMALLAAGVATLGLYPTMRSVLQPVENLTAVYGVGPYGRAPHPMVAAVPYLLFFITAWRLPDPQRGLRMALWCGVWLAACVYTYSFHWPHGVVLLGLWGAWFAWQRQWRVTGLAALALFVGAVLSLPYAYIMQTTPPEVKGGFLEREAMLLSHEIWLEKFIPPPSGAAYVLHFLGFAGVIWLVIDGRRQNGETRRQRLQAALFLGLAMLAAFICTNQQIITGMLFAPQHFYYRGFKTALALGIGVALWVPLWRWMPPRWRQLTWALPLVAMFLIGARVQQHYVTLFQQEYNLSSRQDAALHWLNKHTEPESVVLCGVGTSSIVPVYTHNNVALCHAKDMGPTRMVQQRLAMWADLFGVPDSYLRNMVENVYGFQFFLNTTAWMRYPHHREAWRLYDWLDEVKALRHCAPLNDPPYRIDYLLWCDEENRLPASATAETRLKQYPLWEDNGCGIYDLRPLWRNSAPLP